MLKGISWDVWAVAVIAVAAVLLVAIFDLSPVSFVLIFFALCGYVVVQTIADKRS